MEAVWAALLIVQHWAWVILKYLLALSAATSILVIVFGLFVGKYFGSKGTRGIEEKR